MEAGGAGGKLLVQVQSCKMNVLGLRAPRAELAHRAFRDLATSESKDAEYFTRWNAAVFGRLLSAAHKERRAKPCSSSHYFRMVHSRRALWRGALVLPMVVDRPGTLRCRLRSRRARPAE
jgi:hypothetical protein